MKGVGVKSSTALSSEPSTSVDAQIRERIIMAGAEKSRTKKRHKTPESAEQQTIR